MGYYIELPAHHGKAELLEQLHDGEIVSKDAARTAVSEGKGVVVVMNNGPFEAAGFAYDLGEFQAFSDPRDSRPKKFVVMDREKAEKLSGFSRE